MYLVNFCLGDHNVHQGTIKSGKELFQILSESLNFIEIYNKFGDPICYNKNSITWICKVKEE